MSTSIIESKNYLPEVVRSSRDVQAFCKILDLLINSYKTNLDYYTSLIDFQGCPNELLPYLASYVGYKYDYTLSYDTNRLIISQYPNMIKNRGSEVGIALATALSVNTLGEIDQVEALSTFKFDYRRNENKIYVYVFFPVEMKKLYDLIEVVRPAGCGLILVAADIIETVDGLQVHSYSTQQKYPYDSTRYSISKETYIGFSEITNESKK